MRSGCNRRQERNPGTVSPQHPFASPPARTSCCCCSCCCCGGGDGDAAAAGACAAACWLRPLPTRTYAPLPAERKRLPSKVASLRCGQAGGQRRQRGTAQHKQLPAGAGLRGLLQSCCGHLGGRRRGHAEALPGRVYVNPLVVRGRVACVRTGRAGAPPSALLQLSCGLLRNPCRLPARPLAGALGLQANSRAIFFSQSAVQRGSCDGMRPGGRCPPTHP